MIALMLACYTANAPSTGWWTVNAPQGYVALDADASVGPDAVVRVWEAEQTGVALSRVARHQYAFEVAGAQLLELRFDRSVRGMAYDVELINRSGARIALVDHARVVDDRLRAEWTLSQVETVNVHLHPHGRDVPLRGYRVGSRQLLATVRNVDATFKRAGALYFYIERPRSIRICRGTAGNEVDAPTLVGRIAQPTSLNGR